MVHLKTAKILKNGNNQTVQLPEDFILGSNEVYIQKIGSAVLLVPKEKIWETFMEGINGFTDDYFTAVAERPGNTIAAYEEGE